MEAKKSYSTVSDLYSKLSPKTRKKISEIENKHILYLGNMIKKYGVLFTLRLIKLSIKNKKHRPETKKTEIIWPDKVKECIKEKDIFNKEFNEYIGELEDAGFRLCKRNEPFIDEDTGKICIIKRHYIYFINS